MVTKVLTLFGEELVTEPVKPVRKRAAKRTTAQEKEKKPVDEAEPKPAKPRKTKQAKEGATHTSDALQKWEGDKQYYTIGEVATIFKVNTSNIRFWTKEFDMKVRTTRKGDRLYTPDQVREINTIYHLVKERGYTISGAKAKLKENRKISVQQVDLKKSLQVLRSKLLQIRKQLT
jgi:DNA-binding transcriptional MerR regulator